MEVSNVKNSYRDYTIQIMLEIINKEKPRTVKQLIRLTAEKTGLSREEIFPIVRQLETKGTLKLKSINKIPPLPDSLKKYLFENNFYAIEFWGIITISIVFMAVTQIDHTSNFFFLRVVLGFAYTLFVPGWVLTNIFFPRLYETIDLFERILLAVGLSLGINLLLGLILNVMFEINAFLLAVSTFAISLLLLIFSVIIRLFIARNVIGKTYFYKTNKKEKRL
ncbi:MAG: DUF1616 domain-containing protein [Candidatus Heimdallarchaeaceae archaeon]